MKKIERAILLSLVSSTPKLRERERERKRERERERERERDFVICNTSREVDPSMGVYV